MMITSEDSQSASSESATGLDPPENDEDTTEQPAEAPSTTIGQKESQEVYHFKIVFLMILFLSAIVTATCVYVFITRKEEDQFTKQFQKSAAKVLDAVDNSIDRTLIPMDALAVDLVSYARATNSFWPFVTLPDFPLRLAKAIPLTDTLLLTFIPIVQPQQRADWESYVSKNDGWVNQTQQLQDTWDDYYGPISYEWNTSRTIFTDQGDLEAIVRYVHCIQRLMSDLLNRF
jgi:hypothetical protein